MIKLNMEELPTDRPRGPKSQSETEFFEFQDACQHYKEFYNHGLSALQGTLTSRVGGGFLPLPDEGKHRSVRASTDWAAQWTTNRP